MIIENGYLEEKIKTGGGLDPITHLPIKVSFTFGEKKPCQIRQVEYDNLANSSGVDYIKSSYTVLTENDIESEAIRLTGEGFSKEFSVIQKSVLTEVGLVKIIV